MNASVVSLSKDSVSEFVHPTANGQGRSLAAPVSVYHA